MMSIPELTPQDKIFWRLYKGLQFLLYAKNGKSYTISRFDIAEESVSIDLHRPFHSIHVSANVPFVGTWAVTVRRGLSITSDIVTCDTADELGRIVSQKYKL